MGERTVKGNKTNRVIYLPLHWNCIEKQTCLLTHPSFPPQNKTGSLKKLWISCYPNWELKFEISMSAADNTSKGNSDVFSLVYSVPFKKPELRLRFKYITTKKPTTLIEKINLFSRDDWLFLCEKWTAECYPWILLWGTWAPSYLHPSPVLLQYPRHQWRCAIVLHLNGMDLSLILQVIEAPHCS